MQLDIVIEQEPLFEGGAGKGSVIGLLFLVRDHFRCSVEHLLERFVDGVAGAGYLLPEDLHEVAVGGGEDGVGPASQNDENQRPAPDQ